MHQRWFQSTRWHKLLVRLDKSLARTEFWSSPDQKDALAWADLTVRPGRGF